jgi:hypothetical protein
MSSTRSKELFMNKGDFVPEDKNNSNSRNQSRSSTGSQVSGRGSSGKAGRPPGPNKYVFQKKDILAIETAFHQYGPKWAQIQEEYFSDCVPKVTRLDLANFVKNSPDLKHLAQGRYFVVLISLFFLFC